MYGNRIIDYPGTIDHLLHSLMMSLGFRAGFLWIGFGGCFVLALVWLSFSCFRQDIDSDGVGSLNFYPAIFGVMLSVGIIILRAPTLLLFEQNFDESQWMAGAATLVKDPRFWIAVDGTTSGPLNIFPLVLINVLGGTLNYATVRLFGLLVCVIPSILLLYLSFRNFFSYQVAPLLVLPLACATGFFSYYDVIAYNSEHIPILLIALSTFLFSMNWRKAGGTYSVLFMEAFVIGWFPYSKLQIAPIGFAMALCSISILFSRYRHCPKECIKRISFYVAAGLLPTICVFIYVVHCGAFQDFFQSYVISNLVYTRVGVPWSGISRSDIVERILVLPRVLTTPDTTLLHLCSFVACGASIFLVLGKGLPVSKSQRQVIIFSVVALGFAGLAILMPGNAFDHYGLLFLIPESLVTGVLVGIVLQASSNASTGRFRQLFAVLFIVISIIPSFHLIKSHHEMLRRVGDRNSTDDLRLAEKERVAKIVRKFAKPGDRLAQWGWNNWLYICTGLIQGTREAHQYFQIAKGPLQQYYLRRYAKDLVVNKPTVFVDGMGLEPPWFNDKRSRHEAYPEVAEVVETMYRLVAEVGTYRIYTLRK